MMLSHRAIGAMAKIEATSSSPVEDSSTVLQSLSQIPLSQPSMVECRDLQTADNNDVTS